VFGELFRQTADGKPGIFMKKKIIALACSALLLVGVADDGPLPAARAQEFDAGPDLLPQIGFVLGRAHFLSILCRGRGDQRWRDYMLRVLELEAPPGNPRRDALVAAFNEGYRVEETQYSACSEAAQTAETRTAAEGQQLAERLAARFQR